MGKLTELKGLIHKKIYFLIYLIFTNSVTYAQSTVTKYEVLMNGEIIGTLTATKNVSGKRTVKNISTRTNTKVFFLSLNLESEIYSTYENDIMINSFAYRHVNRGSENIETTVKRKSNTEYISTRNGETKHLQIEGIKYSVIDLYFKEPNEIISVFSNTHAELLELTAKAEGVYELKLPDGKKNKFTYSNGKLVTVEAAISVGQIVFKRKQG